MSSWLTAGRGAEPDREGRRGEARAVDAQPVRGERDRRGAEPAGKARRRAAPRRSGRSPARPARPGRAAAATARAAGSGIAARGSSRCTQPSPSMKPSRPKRPLDRQGQAGDPAALERPVDQRRGAEAGLPVRRRGEGDVAERRGGRRAPASARSGRCRGPPHRPGARRSAASGKPPPDRANSPSSRTAAVGPAIGESLAAGEGEPGAAAAVEAHRPEPQRAAAVAIDEPEVGAPLGAAAPGADQGVGQSLADRPDRRAPRPAQRSGERGQQALARGHALAGNRAVQRQLAPARRDGIAAFEPRPGGAERRARRSGRSIRRSPRVALASPSEAEPALQAVQPVCSGSEPLGANGRCAAPAVQPSVSLARSANKGRSTARSSPQPRGASPPGR